MIGARWNRNLAVLLLGALSLVCGCQLVTFDDPAPVSDSEDANNNGFRDIQPPTGVAFDTSTNVKVLVRNELSAADLAPLANSVGVDPGLVAFADIRINIAWTIRYATGDVQTIESTENLAPFDQRIEIACPQDADLSVEVEAGLPIPGSAPLVVVPLDFDIDTVDYGCGDTIQYRSFINSAGQPDQSVEVF